MKHPSPGGVRFTPITLPDTAFRKSCIARLFRKRANLFAQLLAQVAPRVYEATADRTGWDYYKALLAWCDVRFPIWEPDYLEDEIGAGEDAMDILTEMGIPVSPVGLIDEEMFDFTSATLNVVTYLLHPMRERPDLGSSRLWNRTRDDWTNLPFLRPFSEIEIDVSNFNAPRGRQWMGRYKSLPHLIQYIYHDTGNQLLDLCSYDLDEGGNPPWSIDDINFLIKDWAEALKIWKPLTALIEWLDAEPNGRIPIVLGALAGDQAVRREISRPKHAKTLAEVFDAEDKKDARRARARIRAR